MLSPAPRDAVPASKAEHRSHRLPFHTAPLLAGIFAQTYILFPDSDHKKCFNLKAKGGCSQEHFVIYQQMLNYIWSQCGYDTNHEPVPAAAIRSESKIDTHLGGQDRLTGGFSVPSVRLGCRALCCNDSSFLEPDKNGRQKASKGRPKLTLYVVPTFQGAPRKTAPVLLFCSLHNSEESHN